MIGIDTAAIIDGGHWVKIQCVWIGATGDFFNFANWRDEIRNINDSDKPISVGNIQGKSLNVRSIRERYEKCCAIV